MKKINEQNLFFKYSIRVFFIIFIFIKYISKINCYNSQLSLLQHANNNSENKIAIITVCGYDYFKNV